MAQSDLKAAVRDFWNESSCGEIYAVGETEREKYDTHSQARYALEPYIPDFAKFIEGANRDVLEIGVGMGADHVEWARNEPRSLTGVDLTQRAVEHTRQRLATYGLTSDVRIGDAEKLPFADNSFDIVYSWGVLHHSPDTPQAIREVYRVLRQGGTARIMIYHKYSFTGYMLWLRYALLTGRPTKSLNQVYWTHMESPGTKAYSIQQAQQMLTDFTTVNVRSLLSFSDLLQGAVGQRHQGLLLKLAKRLWPRPLIRMLFKNHGLMLLIEARK
ncbi:MAG: class I SAM-dependent methyltransferase [Caldilineaceae bacterium]